LSVLDRIVDATREEVGRRRALVSLSQLEAALRDRPESRPFQEALTRPGISVIAEHKRRSPSAGVIREDADLVEVVQAYERGGAAAVSVLTEPFHFGGSLDDLSTARAATHLPVLRKDFIVDPYQLYEAGAAGADAVLLIVRILDDARLRGLRELAESLGMTALVEAHGAGELERALRSGARVLGINNRDLTTFKTTLDTTFSLLHMIPTDAVVVSESGIRTPADVDRLGREGVHAVLVGEALLREPDPAAAARALAGRPRQPRAKERAIV
jgi:indole-3-glycerol phosphate synthase